MAEIDEGDNAEATQEIPAKAASGAQVPSEIRRALGSGFEVLEVLGHGGMGMATPRRASLVQPAAMGHCNP